MRSTHRLSSQHKRRKLALQSNPISRALAKASERKIRSEANALFESQLLTTRITMLQAEDGDDATELLSCLAVVIGTPCECASRQGIRESWVRQLHGALRTIQAMCMEGYKWQSQYALALDKAIEIAGQEREELDEGTFHESWIDACALSIEILNHTVRADAIAA